MQRVACALVAAAVVVLGGKALADERALTDIAGGYPGLLFLPEHYGEQPRWPLLLYLHGAIERGDDLERAAATGPPKEIRAGHALPLIVLAPLLPADQRWEPRRLRAVLDAVAARERVDPERVYVTGKSLGGFGVWALAAAYPRRFAALVPVAAAGDPSTVCTLAAVPVWAFHNRDDPVVAVSKDEASIKAFERCGGTARLTVLPAGGHDAWTAAYAKPELYDWLLARRRAAAP
jgi:predicted peptidase